MWNWKFLLSVVLLYKITFSNFPDLPNNSNDVKSEENFKCKNKVGDGSVMCYFMDHVTCSEIFNVTNFTPDGNFSIEEVRESLIVRIHSFNMPDNLPGGLGIIFFFLEELFITNSRLKFISRKGFLNMRYLTFLDLERNEIEEIPQDTFHDLHNLVYLKLNGNKIKSLEASLLEHLHRLHTFSASWNKINTIVESFFIHNYDLRWIYLAKNNLENLEVDFTKIRKLRAVDLRKNFGQCNFSFNINFTNQSTVEIFQRNVTQFCRNKIFIE